MIAPLVSVLIPAYNAAPWIRMTLDSVLSQTWRRLEVVVVDDGSTDGTADLVRGRPEVRLLRQANRGPSAAQNAALRAARGELVQYLDADDALAPDKIALQVAALGSSRSALVLGAWARFHATPEEDLAWAFERGPERSPAEWLVSAWAGGRPMLAPARWLIPRRVLEAAGEWDERLSLLNDMELMTRVLLASERVIPCPQARFLYRSGLPCSVSGRRSVEAWRSARLALELSSAAILGRQPGAVTRRACADVLQEWLFTAYLEAPADVTGWLEERVRALGGSELRLDGGPALQAVQRILGWRRAKALQRAAYRHGFERAAPFYRRLIGRLRGGRRG